MNARAYLVPGVLVSRQGSTRLSARLCAAFARFYFDKEDLLIAAARRQVLEERTGRVMRSPAREPVLAQVLAEMSWKVTRCAVEIDVAGLVCPNSVFVMELERQRDLFALALAERARRGNLVNQALEVFEPADGAAEIVLYDIPEPSRARHRTGRATAAECAAAPARAPCASVASPCRAKWPGHRFVEPLNRLSENPQRLVRLSVA